MATIEEVARRAGVSVATVSRVLNNNYAVSQAKRDSVMEAVGALNYQINAAGRMLRRSEARMILVVCTAVLQEVLEGIQEAGRTLGYDILVTCTGFPSNRCYVAQTEPNGSDGGRAETLRPESFKFLENGLVDGVILMNMVVHDQELLAISRQYPIVQCGEYVKTPKSFLVSTHDSKAAYAMTEHLLSLGRRRVAILMNEIDGQLSNYVRERLSGYRQALTDAGQQPDPTLEFRGDYHYDSGVAAARRMIESGNLPDAVFCTRDSLAVGCLNVFRAAGIRVPEDIAVAGFDNSELCGMCSPPLTSVAQPFREIGQETLKMLVSLIRGEISTGRHLLLDHQLVLRESTVGALSGTSLTEAGTRGLATVSSEAGTRGLATVSADML